MLDHQRQRHGPQLRENKDQMSDMTIPSTPCLGLREDKMKHLNQKQKKEDREKRNRTETV